MSTERTNNWGYALGRMLKKRANANLVIAAFAGMAVATASYLLVLTNAAQNPSADLNSDGKVDIIDMSMLLSNWGKADATSDLNIDGTVNILDLSILLSRWGPVPSATPQKLFGFGSPKLGTTAAEKDAFFQLAKLGNASSARGDFNWEIIERNQGTYNWVDVDRLVAAASKVGIRIIAIATYSPKWASSCPADPDYPHCGPADHAQFGAYAAKIADRYRQGGAFWVANPALTYTPLAAIEIWNEPNHKMFWHSPSGTEYAKSVIAAYKAIKQVDPNVTVLAGALASIGTNTPGEYVSNLTFLSQMYAGGAGGHFDALSNHPYSWGFGKTDANAMFSPTSGSAWSKMADTNPSLRSIMTANGDGYKKIWVTEFGGPTGLGWISEQVQADMARIALEKWKTYPWAGNFEWYQLRDKCTTVDYSECHYGVLRYDGTQKPAFPVLKNAYAE
jgi:polysaccharide biosynthesis protein PslG